MRRRFRTIRAVLGVVLLVATGACGGDGDGAPAATPATATSTSGADTDAAVEGGNSGGEVDRWSAGEATVVVDGTEYVFDLDLCAAQPAATAADANTVTLQLDGSSADGTTRLQVVETLTHDVPSRIQVVSVHFEDAEGDLLRAWEAQRVIDVESGEVDDLHGDGTSPLLQVDRGDDLVVTVEDADFWQFDMTGDDDRAAGTGSLDARCTAA